MKIRHWLMIGFLVVMLLPIAAAYTLYILVQQYDRKQDIVEFLEVSRSVVDIESKLQNAALYDIKPPEYYQSVAELVNDSLHISLYRHDGIVLYSSTKQSYLHRTNTEHLYKDLFDLKKSHLSYKIKKPVFDKNELKGIYEITIARKQWVQAFQQRSLWMTVLFIVFFVLLYTAVIWFIRRKFALPLQELMRQMTAFALNRPVKNFPHRAKDEIGELFAHFSKMKEQIEQSRQEVREQQEEKQFIVASLSHDLKTPLTSIRAYAELLQQNPSLDGDDRKSYSSIIMDKTDYMKDLLDDLTIYSLLRSSSYEMERVEVDGDELFDMLLSGYEEVCLKQGLSFEQECKVSGTYLVHVKQMIRVVDNLMSNAIRHTPPNHSVWLGAVSEEYELPSWVFPPAAGFLNSWRDGGVLLLIQNEGTAIPLEHQGKIFEPFFQADPARTKTKTGHSGLGLSIANIIMDKHGGKINLWSEPGYGTIVACMLPRKDAAS